MYSQRRSARSRAFNTRPSLTTSLRWGGTTLALTFLLAGTVLITTPRGAETRAAASPAETPLPQFGFQDPDGNAADVDDTAEEASPFAGIAEPAPTATPGPLRPSQHTVAEGDTVLSIAERYGLRAETIVWANNLTNPDLIVVGKALRIPPADGLIYSVDLGETLGGIASRYGLDPQAVVAANGLANPDAVAAGTELILPGARPLAPSSAVAAAQRPADQPAEAGLDALTAASIIMTPLPENLQELISAPWLKTTGPVELYADAAAGARRYTTLPDGVRLERTGDLQGRRIPVRDPGDGKTRQAMSGWVDVGSLATARAPSPRELPRGYPDVARMDIFQVFAPYRSQLDGSPYAEANCGPTSIGMAMAAFGVNVPLSRVRAEALDAQHMWGNGTGTLMTALAAVVEAHGLKTHGLRDAAGNIDTWSLDDLRGQLRQRRPVVVQVRYRALPGREATRYYGDHYILITGILDDGFLYNDPIDFDGAGWDRVISGERLRQAMDATDTRYRYAGFSVSE